MSPILIRMRRNTSNKSKYIEYEEIHRIRRNTSHRSFFSSNFEEKTRFIEVFI